MKVHNVRFNGKIMKIIPVSTSYLEHWELSDLELHNLLSFSVKYDRP